MGGWIRGSRMVTSMYLLFLITSWQNKKSAFFRSGNLLSPLTSSVCTFSCLFLTWHQAEVSSAPPRSPYLPLVPPFLSCAPLSHAVHLLCCSLSWQAAIQARRALGGTQFIFLFLSFLHDAMNTISAPCVCGDGWESRKRGEERGVCLSPFCCHWHSLNFPTIGWDEWLCES